ncbi:MAG: hypothetical protein U5K00_10240 [Melioribacteraceae bacterium]|nr:hypothetical protein [Melioribacteraceae bacterium]
MGNNLNDWIVLYGIFPMLNQTIPEKQFTLVSFPIELVERCIKALTNKNSSWSSSISGGWFHRFSRGKK